MICNNRLNDYKRARENQRRRDEAAENKKKKVTLEFGPLTEIGRFFDAPTADGVINEVTSRWDYGFFDGFFENNSGNSSTISNINTAGGVLGLSLDISQEVVVFTQNSPMYSSSAFVANSAGGLKSFGRALGGIGVGLTAVESYADGNLSVGDGVRIGLGVIMIFTPYGWAYGIVDLSVGVYTGVSLTDRIGAGFDNAKN